MFAYAYESHDPAVNQAIVRARAAHGEAVFGALTAVWRWVSTLRMRSFNLRHWGIPAHG